jgi:hypothetical protein
MSLEEALNRNTEALINLAQVLKPQSHSPLETTAEVTIEQVKQALLDLSNTKGRQAALDVLAKFGASKAKDVDPKNYAALIAECN